MQNIEILTQISCPYCGFSERRKITFSSYGKSKEIITCNLEAGGCEKDFVVESQLTTIANIKKIEGEDV